MRLKLCAKCQKVIEAPNTYCEECQKKVDEFKEEYKKKANNRYNKQRNKKEEQFYNSKAWRTLSKKYMDKHSLCELCNKDTYTLAEEVHHIKPIQTPEGWERRLDWHNLIALCHMHHNMMHGRFKRRR